MMFEVPDGAEVHITIGHAPPALPPARLLEVAAPAPCDRRGRPLLITAVAVAALFGTFKLGGYLATPADGVAARLATVTALPAARAAGQPPQVPAAFREQLAQPPRVTPAQGAPAAAPDAKNPFGLQP